MLSVMILFVASSIACPSGSPTRCTLKLCEHRAGRGRCEEYGTGNHGSLGYQNNRASSIQLTKGCVAELFEDRNYGGQMTKFSSGAGNVILDLASAAFPYNIEDKLESAKVYNGRRRIAGPGFFDSFQERDPLCEWILQDGLDNDWTFGDNQEEKDAEMAHLLDLCEEEFEESDARDQCKLYVYAIAAYYDDEELVQDLKFNPEEETADTEYMLCGKVASKINQAIEDGKVSGIKLVKGEDGEPDMFELDEADFEKHPVFVKEGNDAIATILSVGAMISMVVANTLVKVCRDFDPVDYHWLLA